MKLSEWYGVTIGDAMDRIAEGYADREALVCKGQRFTFRQLLAGINQMAKGFLRVGIRQGDHVAVMAPNSAQWVIIRFALTKIGAVIVPINTRYKRDEIKFMLNQSDCSWLIYIDRFLHIDFTQVIGSLCPELATAGPGQLEPEEVPHLRGVICMTDQELPGQFRLDDVLAIGEDGTPDAELLAAQARVDPADLDNILFTSGTTSFPKGCMLSHLNIVQNMFFTGEYQAFTEQDRLLLPLPFTGSFGMYNGLLSPYTHGACVILMENFDPAEALHLIAAERPTVMYGVDTMVVGMMQQPEWETVDFSSVRSAMLAPLSKKVLKALTDRGVWVNQVYGLTETAAIACLVRHDDSREVQQNTNGGPMPGVQVRVVDTESGAPVSAGTMGEVCIRGFNIFRGYYNRPEETFAVMDENGWFHSGDLGEMDDQGHLTFRGRIKEMIKPGGSNVSTLEVQEVILGHPKVREVAVVGVPDERLGEVGMAFIIPVPGETIVQEEIIAWCKERMASYKAPKFVATVETFPMTSTGKVQKAVLRQGAIAELGLSME